MRKKIICLSIITGVFLSIGLGGSKEAIQVNKASKQNISVNVNGQTIPEPEVSRPEVFNL